MVCFVKWILHTFMCSATLSNLCILLSVCDACWAKFGHSDRIMSDTNNANKIQQDLYYRIHKLKKTAMLNGKLFQRQDLHHRVKRPKRHCKRYNSVYSWKHIQNPHFILYLELLKNVIRTFFCCKH
jgi:hypothetical protein